MWSGTRCLTTIGRMIPEQQRSNICRPPHSAPRRPPARKNMHFRVGCIPRGQNTYSGTSTKKTQPSTLKTTYDWPLQPRSDPESATAVRKAKCANPRLDFTCCQGCGGHEDGSNPVTDRRGRLRHEPRRAGRRNHPMDCAVGAEFARPLEDRAPPC